MNEIPKPEYLPANTDSITVASHGRASSQNAPQDHAAAAASSLYEQPINILIVDDEPKNLTVLETVLDDPHYRLVRATSADQALLALVAEEFALLILDIQMPGLSGFELAQMIKERKKTAHVPIIFITAYYNQDQDMLEGYSTCISPSMRASSVRRSLSSPICIARAARCSPKWLSAAWRKRNCGS
jgi:CheY-like chemotaxis protein